MKEDRIITLNELKGQPLLEIIHELFARIGALEKIVEKGGRMSKELWIEEDELPSGTLFWGGDKRGKCLQLTKKEDDGYNYITISLKEIDRFLDKLLEEVIKKEV